MCKHLYKLALIVILPFLIAVSCSPANDQPDRTGDGYDESDYDKNMLQLTLYFRNLEHEPGRPDSKVLVPVTRNIPLTDALARATVTELFRGPSSREADRYDAAPVVDREIIIEDIYIQGGICVIHLDYEGTLFDGAGTDPAESADIFVQSLVRSLTAGDSINAVWVFHNGAPWRGETGEWLSPKTAAGEALQYTIYFRKTSDFDPGITEQFGILKTAFVELESGSDLRDCTFTLIIELLSTGLDQQHSAVLPRNSQALGFTLDGGILTVDLTGKPPQGHQEVLLMVRSLVYTFTDLPEIDRLLVTLDGEPWSDGHVSWDTPLGRADLP